MRRVYPARRQSRPASKSASQATPHNVRGEVQLSPIHAPGLSGAAAKPPRLQVGIATDASEQEARQAAVDWDHRTGDVTAAVGREEADHVGDLLGPAEAAQRNLLHVGRARAL